jgi:hypothetical protein
MTETAGTAPEQVAKDALVPLTEGALALIASDRPWTVDALAELLAPAAPKAERSDPFPVPAAAKPITDKLRAALKRLPAVFGSVTPTEHRKLEAAELAKLTDEAVTIAVIGDTLVKRLDVIKETVRHHMDFLAVEQAKDGAELLRIMSDTGKGHAIAAAPGEPFKVPVPGFEDTWEQRFVSGKVEVGYNQVPGLLRDDFIDRQEYLSVTSAARVFDPVKFAGFVRKNPMRGLEILAKITTRKAPSASLYAPKK